MIVTIKDSTVANNVASGSGKDIYTHGNLKLQGTLNIGEVYLRENTYIETLNEITTTAAVVLSVEDVENGRVVVNPAYATGDVADFISSDTRYKVVQNPSSTNQFMLQLDTSAGKVVNETTTVEYDTLAEAVTAATSGDTLTVLASTIETELITISNKNLIIQANREQTCNFVQTGLPAGTSWITVDAGTEVTLKGSLVLDADLLARVVTVNGTLNMLDNVVIRDGVAATNADNANGLGGGVLVAGTSSARAVFNMSGGMIENCLAFKGAGVSLNGYADMNLSGGVIRGNIASGQGGGVDVGTSTDHNTFTMTGGTVENNAAQTGGGLRMGSNSNAIHVSGGFIQNNTAANRGGGIQVDEGATGNSFKFSGGKVVGNSAKYGGGIDFNVNNAANQVHPATMSGGEISGNTADVGAGVYLSELWALNFSSGSIKDNNGDAVGIYADGGTVRVSGTPVASDPVYLTIGTIMKKDGELTEEASIEVKMENAIAGADVLTKGTAVVVSDDAAVFNPKSYHSTYSAVYNAMGNGTDDDVVELQMDETFHIEIDAAGKELNAIGKGWDNGLKQFVSFDLLEESMLPGTDTLANITPSVLSNKNFVAEVTLSESASSAIRIVTKGVVDQIPEDDEESANTIFALLASVGYQENGKDVRGDMKDVSANEPFSTADMSQKIPYLYLQLYNAASITRMDEFAIEKIVLTSTDGDTITIKNLVIQLLPATVNLHFNDPTGNNSSVEQSYIYKNPVADGGHGVYGDREFKYAGYELLGWSESVNATEAEYTPDEVIRDEWVYDMAVGGEGQNPPQLNLYAVWKRVLVNLTIKKKGAQAIDENQSFIFDVVGTGTDGTAVSMKVVQNGNGSVTIKDLPIGTYTITEKNGWSWRYSPAPANETVVLTGDPIDNTVTFSNTRQETKWLDGEAEAAENQFAVHVE